MNAALAIERRAAASVNERGVMQMTSQGIHRVAVMYEDLHHACPSTQFNTFCATSHAAGTETHQKPAVFPLKHENVAALLASVGAPSLSSIKWAPFFLIIACMRGCVNSFSPNRTVNRCLNWRELGPRMEGRYSHAVKAKTYVTVSVKEAMVKSSGKQLTKRALTLAGLCRECTFWRAVLLALAICHPSLKWDEK